MRKGGGAGKGAAFERDTCVKLSLWITRGEKKDVFWRTAMSGGRATVHKKAGSNIRQSGDICAVSPEGFPLVDNFFVECKHVKYLGIAEFMFKHTGVLCGFWYTALAEAESYNKQPMIIACQNRFPTLIITPIGVQFRPIIQAISNNYEIGLFDAFLNSPPHAVIPGMKPPERKKLIDE